MGPVALAALLDDLPQALGSEDPCGPPWLNHESSSGGVRVVGEGELGVVVGLLLIRVLLVIAVARAAYLVMSGTRGGGGAFSSPETGLAGLTPQTP